MKSRPEGLKTYGRGTGRIIIRVFIRAKAMELSRRTKETFDGNYSSFPY